MWKYGKSSRQKRDTCHPDLIEVMDAGLAISPVDIAIVWGWRGREVQDGMFRMGASKLKWPKSKHNHTERGLPASLAFDFGPWVKGAIPWDDTHLFAAVAGVFMAVAREKGIRLRWGGDWDMDGMTTDQTFMDWGHLELVREMDR